MSATSARITRAHAIQKARIEIGASPIGRNRTISRSLPASDAPNREKKPRFGVPRKRRARATNRPDTVIYYADDNSLSVVRGFGILFAVRCTMSKYYVWKGGEDA